MSYDGRLLRLAQERYEADRSIREAEQAARREAIYTSRPRLRRQGYGFVRRMDQNTCHDAPPFRFSVEKLLPASPLFLSVFYSTRIFPQQQGGQRRVVNFFVF